CIFFFSSRRRHTRSDRDWSSDVCSSDLVYAFRLGARFLEEASSEAERINGRFQTSRWKPIVFRRKHHSHEEISRFYRAASLCMEIGRASCRERVVLAGVEAVWEREDGRR